MIRISILFFVLLYIPAMGQSPASRYKNAMREGDHYFKINNYSEALKKYQDAMIAARECPDCTETGNTATTPHEKIVQVFEQIQKQKNKSDSLAKRAKQMYEVAKNKSRIASSYEASGKAFIAIYKNHLLAEGLRQAASAYSIDDSNMDARNALYASVYESQDNPHLVFPISTDTNSHFIKSVIFSKNGKKKIVLNDETSSGSFGGSGNNDDNVKPVGPKLSIPCPGNKEVLVIDDSNYVKKWDTETGQYENDSVKLSSDLSCTSAVFSGNGKSLITAGNGYLNVWDMASWTLISDIRMDGVYTSPVISDNGAKAYVTVYDSIKVIDALTGKQTNSFLIDANNPPSAISFSPDGRYLLVATTYDTLDAKNTSAKLYDLEQKDISLVRDFDSLVFASYTPDGRFLFIGRSDSSAILYDLKKNTDTINFLNLGNVPNSIIFSPNGNKIILTFTDETMGIGTLSKDKFQLFNGNATDAVFSPDSNKIITIYDNTVKLWDTGNYVREIATLSGSENNIIKAGFSANSKIVWAISDNKEIILWNIENFNEKGTLYGNWESANFSAFSTDGNLVFTLHRNKGKIVSVTNSADSIPILGYMAANTRGGFSPDSRRLVTRASDTLKIWDTKTGKLVGNPIGNVAGIFSLAGYSADNRNVFLIYEGKLSLVDVADGRRIPIDISADSVISASFSADNHHLMALQKNGTFSIWNIDRSSTQPIFTTSCISVLFSPDRKSALLKSFSKDTNSTMRYRISKTGTQNKSDTLVAYVNTEILLRTTFKTEVLKKEDTLTIFKKCDTAFYSPDGRRILAYSSSGFPDADNSNDNHILLWNMENSHSLFFETRKSKYNNLKITKPFFSAKNEFIFMSVNDATVIFYDNGRQETGTAQYNNLRNVVCSRDNKSFLWIMAGDIGYYFNLDRAVNPTKISHVSDAVFSPDSKYLLIKYYNTYRLFDTTGELATLPIGTARRYFFSADSKRIITQYDNKPSKVWLIDPADIIANLYSKFGLKH